MEIQLAIVAIGVIGGLVSFAGGDVGSGLTFVLVFIAGVVILSWVLSFMARRQQHWLVNASPAAVNEAVQGCFSGVGWKQVNGRGQLNFQARGFGINSFNSDRPVISVDIEDQGDGTTGVGVWTSSWTTQLGVMALCDRVVSKRFWLGRRLTELSASAAVGGASYGTPAALAGQPSTPAAAASGGGDEKVVLANPGLPEDHPRQIAYELLTAVGLAFVVYGPGEVAGCFHAVSQLSPVLLEAEGHSGSDFLGSFPRHQGLFLLCFDGPYGSALAVCVTADSDTNFVTEHIAGRLRELHAPWHWGIGTVGGTVPVGFARIVDPATIVELHRIPQLQHNNPGPTTYQPHTFPDAGTTDPLQLRPNTSAALSPESFLSNPASAETVQFPAATASAPPPTYPDPHTTPLTPPPHANYPPPTGPAANYPPPVTHSARYAQPDPPPPAAPAVYATSTKPAVSAAVNGRIMIIAVAAVIFAIVAAVVMFTNGDNSRSSAPYSSDSGSGASINTATPATAAQEAVPVAPESRLTELAASDRSYIDAHLLDVWEPQLSSKRPGLFADGITWSFEEILREHMALRQRFPSARLVWSGDWPVYGDPTWWVTVAGVPFSSGEQANQWCADQNFDADHCLAKMLSHTKGTAGTTLYRK